MAPCYRADNTISDMINGVIHVQYNYTILMNGILAVSRNLGEISDQYNSTLF